MFFQMAVLVLLENIQGVIPLSTQLLQFDYQPIYSRPPTPRVEDKVSPYRTISLTSPLLLYSTKELENKEDGVSNSKRQTHVVVEGPRRKIRREVPATSFGRSGADNDGLTVALPDGEDHPHAPHPANRSESEEEGFTEDGFFTQNLQDDDDINSTTPVYQEPLPSGERGQGLHWKYSFMTPGGSIVNTSWTADEKGFRAQGPPISVFGLGFGRRR